MSKIRKILLGVIIIFVGVIALNLNKTVATINVPTEYLSPDKNTLRVTMSNWNSSLWWYREIMCLAHGQSLPTTTNYTKKSEFDINPNFNSTSPISEEDAVLSYIIHEASCNEDDGFRNLNSTPSQNAMWAYWKKWYNARARANGVPSNFDYTSSVSNRTQANSILQKAYEYASYVTRNIPAVTLNIADVNITSAGTIMQGIKVIKHGNAQITGISTSHSINGNYSTVRWGYDNNDINKIDIYLNYNDSIYHGSAIYIKVDYSYTYYKSKVRLYSTTNARDQNLAVVDCVDSTITDSTTVMYGTTNNDVEFSLQKFIVGKGPTKNSITSISGRDFKDANSIIKGDGIRNGGISNFTTWKSRALNGGTKYSNAVSININDYVVYRISVYRDDTNINESDIRLNDQYSIADGVELEGVYRNPNLTDPIRYTNSNGHIIISNKNSGNNFQVLSHGAGYGTASCYVVLRYTREFTGIIENRAYLTGNKKSNRYRIEDYDYVTMNLQSADVSLQKIVYSVNDDASLGRPKATNDHFWGTSNSDNRWECDDIELYSLDNYYYKKYNPVPVYCGDTVTYAIRVQNHGESPVIITNITDNLPNGVTLKSIQVDGKKADGTNLDNSLFGRSGSGSINLVRTYWLDDGSNNFYLGIESSNNKIIIYITVQLPSNFGGILRNHAEIITMKNSNGGYIVDDSPGNNEDADYINVELPKVSLQKIVYSVRTAQSQESIEGTDISNYNVNPYGSGSQRGSLSSYWGSRNKNSTSNYWECPDQTNTNLHDGKSINPVKVPSGYCIVSYSIRVQNDGNMPVRITKIKDIFSTETNNAEIRIKVNPSNDDIDELGSISSNGDSNKLKSFNQYTVKKNSSTVFDNILDESIYLSADGTTNSTYTINMVVLVKTNNNDASKRS